MPTLAAITSALLEAGLDLTAPEVIDVIWFFDHIGLSTPTATKSPGEREEPDPLTTPQLAPEAAPAPVGSEDDDDLDDIEAQVEVPDLAGADRGAGLHVASGGRGVGSGPRSGLGMRVPGVAALPEPLKLARALRPLMRRRPSRTAFVLDEIGTVERIADMRVIIPQMRPAPARWFELALVVDKSASMAVWQATIQEFRRLVERQGAFRDVRSWALMTDFTDGVVRLYPGLGPVDRQRASHKPSELVDATGRRITLVVSDCVSPAWHNGEMTTILSQWQRSGPLAILQMLPEHLWETTGLGGATEAELTATLPGALNSQLRVSIQDAWYKSQRADLAVPIVQLNPRSLHDWSALVMGSPQSRVAGFVFPPRETMTHSGEDETPKNNDADQLVGNFRALVSEQARQLGGVLSTIPVLTLPLMRVVQATLLPDTDVTHLAELFIGGILREQQDDAHLLDPDTVEYTFVPGVSELLIKTVSSYDAIAALSLFVERHLGRPINFFALLEDPSKVVGMLGLDKESQPFASLTAGALRRLGGSFARVAEELQKSQTPPAPPEHISSVSSSKEVQVVADLPSFEKIRGLPVIASNVSERWWFASDYDPTLYVHRIPLEDNLIRTLLNSSIRSKGVRNIVVEGPAGSGKSWLMEYVARFIQDNNEENVVLRISIQDLVLSKRKEDVIVHVFQRFWADLQKKYPGIVLDLGYSYKNYNEIRSFSSTVGYRISGYSVFVIICIDGLDEIIEYSHRKYGTTRSELLNMLEDMFIDPLMRSNSGNVRILVSRRGVNSYFRSFIVRKNLSIYRMDSNIQKKNDLFYNQINLFKTKHNYLDINIFFDEMPVYNWDNLGVNALLIKHIIVKGSGFADEILRTCFVYLTRSALGVDLDDRYRLWLEKILLSDKIEYTLPVVDDVRIALNDLNQMLDVNDASRDQFLDTLQFHGIASLRFPYVNIQPEVVALFFEIQSRSLSWEYLVEWFLERYEDPAHHVPYVSAEGGYQYLNPGEPYYAQDVLNEHFEYLLEGVRNKAVIELNHQASEWVKKNSY